MKGYYTDLVQDVLHLNVIVPLFIKLKADFRHSECDLSHLTRLEKEYRLLSEKARFPYGNSDHFKCIDRTRVVCKIVTFYAKKQNLSEKAKDNLINSVIKII